MPDTLLSAEEKILFKSRFSLLKFFRQWFLSMLICGVSMTLMHYLGSAGASGGLQDDTRQVLVKIFGVVAVGSFSVFLLGFLLYKHQFIILTTHRLMTTSIWNLKSDSVVLRNINNIEKRKNVLGLIFGYGTIRLQDTDGTWINMAYIPHVDTLEAKLAAASMRQGAVGT